MCRISPYSFKGVRYHMLLGLKNKLEIHFFNSSIYVIDENGMNVIPKENDWLIRYLLREKRKFEDVVKECMEVYKIENPHMGYAKVQSLFTMYRSFFEVENNLTETEYKKELQITGKEGCYYPVEIQVSLTNRCMHRCRHCYEEANKTGKELDYVWLCDLLEKVKGYVTNITLTGGEPVLYSKLEDLLDRYGEDFKFTIITSGFFGQKKISDSLIQKIQNIRLSIYGASEEEHDSFVGVKGSYIAVTDTIRRMIRLGVMLSVQTQAYKTDFDYLNRLIKNCINLGIKELTVGQVYPVGRGKIDWKECNEQELEENIIRLRKMYGTQINILCKPNKRREDQTDNGFFKCGAGQLRWHICEDGKIIPCALVDRTFFDMGSIRDAELPISQKRQKEIVDGWKENREIIEREYHKEGLTLASICEQI